MKNLIDCKGLKCPQPVINTKKYFDSIQEGQATVVVDNEVSKNNVAKFAEGNGFSCNIEEKENLYYITITKGASCKLMSSDTKKLTIVISNNRMGLGDDTLGATLMKSYLYALSESENLPSDLIFLNAGVKLAIKGSDCLDSINKLSEKGVNILNCGTCLDFYGLKEELAVGEITNMYTIVEKMNSSDNTIKL
ncbi:sulfurtransferase-like selenium metabolism protein YedF [Clostridiaceae bacterium UIB06]|uniref:Sulfurtransferase-like selenium metabolism protein YedF n=1 Tax=Clostridium thailandense TaxID=2794346 RepID=A0A949WS98_9CLOT|nr:sulfurtransferase-like selenium metabolism protein YedF [Clostridium thailandense]MBV7274851.1 sulfurtransferase-like selenium metabolism protein YedF [Clostridium thailandense]MCH5137596.1 sulfurtransferase-like selenium metabolism protein YedF [Clostridiaceae bacterium UIB06]